MIAINKHFFNFNLLQITYRFNIQMKYDLIIENIMIFDVDNGSITNPTLK